MIWFCSKSSFITWVFQRSRIRPLNIVFFYDSLHNCKKIPKQILLFCHVKVEITPIKLNNSCAVDPWTKYTKGVFCLCIDPLQCKSNNIFSPQPISKPNVTQNLILHQLFQTTRVTKAQKKEAKEKQEQQTMVEGEFLCCCCHSKCMYHMDNLQIRPNTAYICCLGTPSFVSLRCKAAIHISS